MRQAVVVMYDAEAELDEWMHGPHYDEVLATPGVVAVQRLRVTEGPEGSRRYIAIIETSDLEATLAWRNSPAGKRSQDEANERGVSRRCSMLADVIFDASAAHDR
ncbi:DUF4286 family protein [Arvimicrobium flavum]|uniref:DUF4286 family protein n=1 Tax=Arvimicrobium flavum TaxID=3393320 RepID=UPI00237B3EE9|nr:DUF4286 family protein [Mesorhizobium shangrilense]